MGWEDNARRRGAARKHSEEAEYARQKRADLIRELRSILEWLDEWSQRTGLPVEDIRVMAPDVIDPGSGRITVEFLSYRTVMSASHAYEEGYERSDLVYSVHMVGNSAIKIESEADLEDALARHNGRPLSRRQLGKLRKQGLAAPSYYRDNGVPVSEFI
jgi:hypothetical protein